MAILTSGDEVAAHDEPRDVYQVHDVNGPMLESLVQSMGAVVRWKSGLKYEARTDEWSLAQFFHKR